MQVSIKKAFEFPIFKRSFWKIKTKNNIIFNEFWYEGEKVSSIYIYLEKKIENHIELLFLGNGDESHYVNIK